MSCLTATRAWALARPISPAMDEAGPLPGDLSEWQQTMSVLGWPNGPALVVNRRASTFRWRSSERAIQGQGQRRHPGLGGGLGAVRAAPGARRGAQRRLHRPGRRRVLGDVLLRRADQDAAHRQD